MSLPPPLIPGLSKLERPKMPLPYQPLGHLTLALGRRTPQQTATRGAAGSMLALIIPGYRPPLRASQLEPRPGLELPDLPSETGEEPPGRLATSGHSHSVRQYTVVLISDSGSFSRM